MSLLAQQQRLGLKIKRYELLTPIWSYCFKGFGQVIVVPRIKGDV